jgi:hypothetical protein
MRRHIDIAIIVAIFAIAFPSSLRGQIVILKPLHISHAQGYVVTAEGKPLKGIQVAFISGAQPALASNTDADGHFDFTDARGEYLFHVKSPGFAIAARQVIARRGLRSLFRRGLLFVVMRPAADCDDCTSLIFATKKQADRAIRENSRNHD